MAKIETTKTELVWPGKYDDDGRLVEPPRVNLPFQVVETINQGRAVGAYRIRPRRGRQAQADQPLRRLEGRRGRNLRGRLEDKDST